jgi:hypothetical protein
MNAFTLAKATLLAVVLAAPVACADSPTNPAPGAGGGGGGGGGNMEAACAAGAQYVCQCSAETPGGLGNKWCDWDGLGFTDCLLCGAGGPIPTEGSCSTAADCPGEDGPCKERACEAGACVLVRYQPGSAPPDTVPNDCKRIVCDGEGEAVSVPHAPDCAGACDATGVCRM